MIPKPSELRVFEMFPGCGTCEDFCVLHSGPRASDSPFYAWVSINGGAQYIDHKDTIILIMGTPKMVALIFGNPQKGLRMSECEAGLAFRISGFCVAS